MDVIGILFIYGVVAPVAAVVGAAWRWLRGDDA